MFSWKFKVAELKGLIVSDLNQRQVRPVRFLEGNPFADSKKRSQEMVV